MSKRSLLWLNGSLALLLFASMVYYTLPLQPAIPCLQLTYSEAAFKAIIAQWGTDGLVRFRAHFLIDFPVLLSYGLFGYRLSCWTALFARQSAHFHHLMTWSLPIAAALDIGENLLHLYLTSGALAIPAELYLVVGIVASAKWLLIVIFIIGAGYAWLGSHSRQT